MFVDKQRTLTPLNTVRFPLWQLSGVDLRFITDVELELARTGEVLVDDVELVP